MFWDSLQLGYASHQQFTYYITFNLSTDLYLMLRFCKFFLLSFHQALDGAEKVTQSWPFNELSRKKDGRKSSRDDRKNSNKHHERCLSRRFKWLELVQISELLCIFLIMNSLVLVTPRGLLANHE